MSMFRFPRTRFVDELDFCRQLKHVRSELDEVWQELERLYPDLADPVRVGEECVDLLHSVETLLRILQEKHGVDVGALSAAVRMKNYNRGYYHAQG